MIGKGADRYARSVAAVATDVAVALRASGAWCPAVTMHMEHDMVVLDWLPEPEHGAVYGHTVRADTATAGRYFLRRILALHAPVHGWQIDPEPDRYEWVSPIRVRRQ